MYYQVWHHWSWDTRCAILAQSAIFALWVLFSILKDRIIRLNQSRFNFFDLIPENFARPIFALDKIWAPVMFLVCSIELPQFKASPDERFRDTKRAIVSPDVLQTVSFSTDFLFFVSYSLSNYWSSEMVFLKLFRIFIFTYLENAKKYSSI